MKTILKQFYRKSTILKTIADCNFFIYQCVKNNHCNRK